MANVSQQTRRLIFWWSAGVFLVSLTIFAWAGASSPEVVREVTKTSCGLTCSEPYTYEKEVTVFSNLYFALIPLVVVSFVATFISGIASVDA